MMLLQLLEYLAKFAKTAEALRNQSAALLTVFTMMLAGIAKLLLTFLQEMNFSAKLLGSMQSPITNFARVIKQIAEKNEEVA